VTASLPAEAVQLRKRAARACLEAELFDAVSLYHLTCRLPPAVLESNQIAGGLVLLTSAAQLRSPLKTHGVRKKKLLIKFNVNSGLIASQHFSTRRLTAMSGRGCMVKAQRESQSQFQTQTKHYHRLSSIVNGMLRQSGSTT
jgi:hypothetical protein